jgi:hypothetical protein
VTDTESGSTDLLGTAMISLKQYRRALVLPIILALVQVSAEPPKETPDKVTVSLVAILGHNRDEIVDPRLECIRKEVQKAVPQLTGFKMGKTFKRDLTVGVREAFELCDDQVAYLTLIQPGGKDTPIQLKLTPPQMGDVTYETTCGGFFTIITKCRTRNKDVLILAIRDKHCQK